MSSKKFSLLVRRKQGVWGGKYVGITKETWIKSYLALDDDSEAVRSLQQLGTLDLTIDDLQNDKLPSSVAPLEVFLCQVYAPKNCDLRSIPELRWELFRSKNLEGEKLPPTVATFYPHIMRSNFTSRRDKSYVRAHPNLPALELSGWDLSDDGERYTPVRCLIGPAPKEVTELVKCSCKSKCEGRCSCVKNGLSCTPLCKCYSSGCDHFSSKPLEESVEDGGDEDDSDEFF